MIYHSTRGGERGLSSAECIVKGLAVDGGLYTPESIPQLSKEDLILAAQASYVDVACMVLGRYLTDFTDKERKDCVSAAYGKTFGEDPAPIIACSNGMAYLELWHGPTCAFKDMALQLTPHLMSKSLKKTASDKRTLVLVATSGDTGKAALEGYRDVEGTAIAVFYPDGGVSKVQQRQMTTQEGKNVFVSAIRGNFDDAQNAVKALLEDKAFARLAGEKGWSLSSANSINWGRLVPQIVYYVRTSAKIAEQHNWNTDVDFVVPTGNFGNILAAWYAKKMGAPIGTLVCASNRNDVLHQFITTGVYDRRRPFYKTISPSMDILISSNLERLLYALSDGDSEAVSGWMKAQRENGVYTVSGEVLAKIQEHFCAYSCDDIETEQEIRTTWKNNGYLVDTHTAVAGCAAKKYRLERKSENPLVVVSTASPFKFASDVFKSITGVSKEGFEALDALSNDTGWEIPSGLRDLEDREIRHSSVIDHNQIADFVENLL